MVGPLHLREAANSWLSLEVVPELVWVFVHAQALRTSSEVPCQTA